MPNGGSRLSEMLIEIEASDPSAGGSFGSS